MILRGQETQRMTLGGHRLTTVVIDNRTHLQPYWFMYYHSADKLLADHLPAVVDQASPNGSIQNS